MASYRQIADATIAAPRTGPVWPYLAPMIS
jgi:hypothetical protein